MHVLYIAYPLLTVSEDSAGGAEQVLWTLEREMSRRGVATTVAASAGSRVAGELFATGDPRSQPDDFERRNREHQARILEWISRRARARTSFDLVHDMSGSFWPQAAEVDAPVLATLHLPPSFYAPGLFQNIPSNVSFNCVSISQAFSFADVLQPAGAVTPRKARQETRLVSGHDFSRAVAGKSRLGFSRCKITGAQAQLLLRPHGKAKARALIRTKRKMNFADARGINVVNNGIPLDRFTPSLGGEKRTGLLWLGRICEEKAPHLALEIAARARLPVTLAGQVYPFSYHQKYFENEIAPRLREVTSASFLPSPSLQTKLRLLGEAQAVLITSQAEETSSLVAMEAAASGTPVIAFARGAHQQVVCQGKTGFLVEGIDDAGHALRHLGEIDPEVCVRHAREHFSSATMADNYAALYQRVLSSTLKLAPAEK